MITSTGTSFLSKLSNQSFFFSYWKLFKLFNYRYFWLAGKKAW